MGVAAINKIFDAYPSPSAALVGAPFPCGVTRIALVYVRIVFPRVPPHRRRRWRPLGHLSLPIAFVAGLASCLSPCFIPLVPTYLAVLSKAKPGSGRIWAVASFVAGFALVFSLLGYGASYVGRWLSAFLPLFRYVGGFVVVLMGLHLLGLLRWQPLLSDRRVSYMPARLTPANAFLLGTTFAVGWSACTGPILASILVLASIQASAWSGVALLGAYSLGIAVPLVLLMVLSRFLSRFRLPAFVPKASHYVAGVLMVGLGVLMMTGRLAALSSF